MNNLTTEEKLAVLGIETAMQIANDTAENAGWYKSPQTGKRIDRNFGECVALMHSELSEALEADRKDLMDNKLTDRKGVEVELADCVIRIFDIARSRGYDLAGAIIEKNRYNRNRIDHKLSSRKAGGKKY
jgi:NTP pyrophosphatase (non-canonical NTP hydrolase)